MEPFDLDTTLLEFPNELAASSWTIREAVEGVQIFGGIGSGKTSGSGQFLALKYLANDFGGLVLTAKPDEKELWLRYCEETGRTDDLIIIEPGGEHSFNFLEYESSQGSATFTENLVQVLKTVISASEEKNGRGDKDSFWENSLDMLMFNVIDLCLLAYGEVSVEEMHDIVMTAPKQKEGQKPNETQVGKRGSGKATSAFDKAYVNAVNAARKKIDEWEQSLSEEERIKDSNPEKYDRLMLEAIPSLRVLKFVDQFFTDNYRTIADKTRSIIDFSFATFLYRLLRDPVYSLFCSHKSTVTPEDCLEGKIILLNLPVKIYNKVGRDIQIMFKYIWQRAMEKRNIRENGRPIFLWADEAQLFLHEHDAEYQATARSSRIATVYISQNLPNYHANMGGTHSEHRVKSFLGTLGTKIFHANADIDTNKYASELIGQGYTPDNSRSTTTGKEPTVTRGLSFELEYMVRPERFVGLKTGGPLNHLLVEAYIHRQSRSFKNRFNHKLITFNQINHY